LAWACGQGSGPGFALADYQWVSVIIRAALLSIKWPLANKAKHLARVWGSLDWRPGLSPHHLLGRALDSNAPEVGDGADGGAHVTFLV